MVDSGKSQLLILPGARRLAGRLCFWLCGVLVCLASGQAFPSSSLQVLSERAFSAARFKHLSIEDGLSQSTVNTILLDHYGLIWIGTQDGLNRYDGYGFTIFRHVRREADSLSDSYITALYEDKRGRLWVGTQGGGLNLFRRDEGTFQHFLVDKVRPGALRHGHVTALAEDASGELWVGTSSGLYRLRQEKGVFEKFEDPKLGGKVQVIYATGPELWVGTDRGLFLIQQADERPVTPIATALAQAFDGLSITAICQWGSSFWIGTLQAGLFQLSPQTGVVRPFALAFDPEVKGRMRITDLAPDEKGGLWVGSWSGMVKIESEQGAIRHYRAQNGRPNHLNDNRITKVVHDRSGQVWVGTWGAGLNILNKKTEEIIHIAQERALGEGLNHPDVYGILLQNGKLWLGTDGGGLACFDMESDTFDYFTHDPNNENSLSNDSVLVLAGESSEDRLWIGTRHGGLNKFEHGQFIHYLDTATVRVIQPHEGELYLGSNLGFVIFQPDTGHARRIYPSAAHPVASIDEVWALLKDEAGHVWLGTQGNGLVELDLKSGALARYTYDPNRPQSLSHERVTALHRSRDGSLWVGTWAGLNHKLEGVNDGFQIFTTAEGLANNVVYAIEEDGDGFLWISTNQGLSRMDVVQQTFVNFDRSDGLQSNEFNLNSSFKSASGQLFFGGINGCTAFFPHQLRLNTHVPNIIVTSIRRLGSHDQVDMPLNRALLSFKHHEAFFSISFAALDFVEPDKNQYAYQWEGIKKEWVDLGSKREVTFTNLNPGQYRLKIKGSNNDRIWNEEGIALKIVVDPPPWKTWWAFTLYFLSAVALLGGFLGKKRRERLQELKKQETQRAELEHKVRERTDELRQKNKEILKTQRQLVLQEKMASLGTLTAGIAHEVNTPIGISVTAASFLQEGCLSLTEKYNESRLTARDMESFLAKSEDATSLLLGNLQKASSLIRSFKQLAVDQTSEQKRIFNLKEYINREIRLSLSGTMKIRQHNLTLTGPDDLRLDSYPGAFSLIFTNLIVNTLNHGYGEDDEADIFIHIKRQKQGFVIHYRDKGKGMDRALLEKIYDPFFTTRRGEGGTGIGMHLVYNTVTQKLGGQIQATSELGLGMAFKLSFPESMIAPWPMDGSHGQRMTPGGEKN